MGGYTKIFPVKDEQAMEKYNAIIQKAYSTHAEEKGSLRMKMMEKEAKKLIKDDFKQKKQK